MDQSSITEAARGSGHSGQAFSQGIPLWGSTETSTLGRGRPHAGQTPQGPPQYRSQRDAQASARSPPGAWAGWRGVIAQEGGRQPVPPPSPQALLIKGSEFPSASQPAPQ